MSEDITNERRRKSNVPDKNQKKEEEEEEEEEHVSDVSVSGDEDDSDNEKDVEINLEEINNKLSTIKTDSDNSLSKIDIYKIIKYKYLRKLYNKINTLLKVIR